MNYYIDFDNTLYNTPKLTTAMLECIATEIATTNAQASFNIAYKECTTMFTREHIYDIYKLVRYFSQKYNINAENTNKKIDTLLSNSFQYVYEDVIPFLEKIKKEEHKIYMLTYFEENLEYQLKKIAGSKLANYFDAIYTTKALKYELDLNYSNGIFIDDKPSDLVGLYSKKPLQVIRLKRDTNKYSTTQLDISEIKEYKSFEEIII